jgi:ribA/ribD-fused uncharacterized protein
MRETDKFIFFFGEKDWLSQWYPSKFIVNGITFPTAEHFMIHRKATTFEDLKSAEKILKAKTSKEAKAIGRKIKNFDSSYWDKIKEAVVIQGNINKFNQNEKLKEKLLATGDKILVEASPYDKIWGIGIGENNIDATNPDRWRGQNLLGKCIMEVRFIIKNINGG